MSSHPANQVEFSFPVDIVQMPGSGRAYDIVADAEARARVATRLGVQSVESLKARFDLKPSAGGLLRVTGRVDAALTQTCVVSLAPVPASIREEISTTFTTAERAVRKAEKDEKLEETIVFVEGDDPPEVAADGKIDLGELAVVQVALGLDPYPRAPGAAFKATVWVDKDDNARQNSPFAALAKLKPAPRK